jgi:hypothetical protein
MQTKIPAEFGADLKAQNLIEQNAPVPQMATAGVNPLGQVMPILVRVSKPD